MSRALLFRGRIAGWGTTSGTRVVVGRWDVSPFGAFADVMVERPDGERVLLAPTAEVAALVASTYTFDRVEVVPVSVTDEAGTGAPPSGEAGTGTDAPPSGASGTVALPSGEAGTGAPPSGEAGTGTGAQPSGEAETGTRTLPSGEAGTGTGAQPSGEGGSGAAPSPWLVVAGPLEARLVVGQRTGLGRALRAVPDRLAASRRFTAVTDPVARALLHGVRTRGSAGAGRVEHYGATDVHGIVDAGTTWDGEPLGGLAPVDPPVRFGFGSTPRRPAVTDVVTTIVLPRD